MNQKEARLIEFAGLLSRRIDELREPPAVLAGTPPASCFQLVADTLPIVVWKASGDGEVTFISRRWFDLLGAEDMDWPSLLHPDDRDEFISLWAFSVETKRPFRAAARFRDQSGNYHTLLSIARPDGPNWVGTSTEIGPAREKLPLQVA